MTEGKKLNDAERMKRQRTAKAMGRAKAAVRASAGRIDAATQRTLNKIREQEGGGEPW